ncbi:MAG: enoyl-CoA hydratase/isomerase family protein [Planctomycetes bacterium]|nr:enoyl-CoA hydratase/isomerase family protein [Planctomycetota bacterium]
MSNAWSLIKEEGGIIKCIFDLPGEKVNKFSFAVMQEFAEILEELKTAKTTDTLIIMSAKEGIFIAGADINEISQIKDKEDAYEKSKLGQKIFNSLENLPCKTIAYIHGACMGGGMECALACDYRIISDDETSKCALPEVKLGILPAWGGTWRFSQLIGLSASLPYMLTGRNIPAKKAFKIGLCDAIVAHEYSQSELQRFCQQIHENSPHKAILKKRKKRTNLFMRSLERNSLGKDFILNQALKSTLKQSHGHYPSPEKIIELLKSYPGKSSSEAMELEAQAFSELMQGEVCQNILKIYLANEELKSHGKTCPTSIPKKSHMAVLGAGIMGGGLAWLISSKGHFVRMKDISQEALAGGYKAGFKIYSSLFKKRRIKKGAMSLGMQRITSSLDYKGFEKVDLVVEAVVENMDLKKTVLAEMESSLPQQSIIASNTSALSISTMAESLKYPERFAGFHFFNPVNRMPLVEVIPGKKTSPETISSLCHFAQSLGKTPIVVKDVPGFLVNRILLPYINESVRLVEEGADIKMVDKSLSDFGMPMGPLFLSDEVGLDVGYKVAKLLEKAYGERMKVCALLEEIHSYEGVLGKKSGIGFYHHNARKLKVNQKIEGAKNRKQDASTQFTSEDIINRTMLLLINEAALCIEEGVIAKATDLDLAMVMGIGFPPFRGGPLSYAQSIGISKVVEMLNTYHEKYGMRYKPSQYLISLSQDNKNFNQI